MKVVELDLASVQLANDGELPAGELDGEACHLAAVEPGGPLHRLRQAQTPAGSADRLGVTDLGLNLNNVRHEDPPVRVRESRAGDPLRRNLASC